MKINLQIFGGRGASSKGGGSKRKASGGSSLLEVNTKFSKKELDGMDRKQLEDIAKVVYVKMNVPRGLTEEKALQYATDLMDGNTTAQLRKYIKRYG